MAHASGQHKKQIGHAIQDRADPVADGFGGGEGFGLTFGAAANHAAGMESRDGGGDHQAE